MSDWCSCSAAADNGSLSWLSSLLHLLTSWVWCTNLPVNHRLVRLSKQKILVVRVSTANRLILDSDWGFAAFSNQMVLINEKSNSLCFSLQTIWQSHLICIFNNTSQTSCHTVSTFGPRRCCTEKRRRNLFNFLCRTMTTNFTQVIITLSLSCNIESDNKLNRPYITSMAEPYMHKLHYAVSCFSSQIITYILYHYLLDYKRRSVSKIREFSSLSGWQGSRSGDWWYSRLLIALDLFIRVRVEEGTGWGAPHVWSFTATHSLQISIKLS